MNLLLERFCRREYSGQVPGLLHIFVAYDVPLARQSAQQTAIRLAEQRGDGSSVDWNFQSFSDLAVAAAAEDAARSAAGADMVVFATVDARGLPFPVKAWVERWLARKGNRESALIALVGRNSQAENGSTPAQHYLGAIAREAGMSYREGRFEMPVADEGTWRQNISSRATRMTVLMEELLRLPPPPHWGINE